MTQPALRKTRRSFISFTAILASFLIIADTFVIAQQSHSLRTEMALHTKHEFDLFGELVAGFLTKGDYAAVEEAAINWGKKRNDILEIKIATANGFNFANYQKNKASSNGKPSTSKVKTKRFQSTLNYALGGKASITMLKDISSVNAVINRLTYQLITFSILLVILLGIFLQRMAIQPLRKEITKHEQTEQILQKRSAELEESNKELESYSYSIAHDLRAPLRAITSFSQILKEDAAEKLNEEEKDHFRRIIDASKRMADLIDDILELGRVTRRQLNSVEVDLSALAWETKERLIDSEEKHDTEWQIQEDIKVTGDKTLLTSLLDNLLGNAYKFSGKEKQALIEFGETTYEDDKGITSSAYYVKDNGKGFDMKYADKLFQPFQRLDANNEFEGTGIGLATVQRIINRHGGRIWVQATPNKGATFYFTLPGSRHVSRS